MRVAFSSSLRMARVRKRMNVTVMTSAQTTRAGTVTATTSLVRRETLTRSP